MRPRLPMACGICGFAGFQDPVLIDRMLDAIRHRGPDSSGKFLDSDVSLGVDRLSIIDLVKGDQPIHNENSSIWVVYNGEIYNYVELRRELESLGHSFYTDSDTEVIVHCYESFGESCVQKFRGMFAFALWDSNRKLLLLARDRFGKKPLYYAKLGNELLFASEIKAIRAHDEFKPTIDQSSVDHFLSYSYIPSPHTVFNEVRSLLPGHYMVYSRGEVSVSEYWDLGGRAGPPNGDVLERLDKELEEACRIRLRSDVPVGLFLSGGVDSSTVAGYIAKVLGQDLLTYSVSFGDPDVDETLFAKEVADYLGLENRVKSVAPDDVVSMLPRLVWHFDEPFSDFSAFPTFFVSELAAKERKVVLSGDGGDELFLGYQFLVDSGKFQTYRSVPKPVANMVLQALASLPVGGEVPASARWAISKEYAGRDDFGRFFARISVFTEGELSRLRADGSSPPIDTGRYTEGYLRAKPFPDYMTAANYATIKTYLAEDILVKVDRASMANSLEVRCPLLDHQLAEFVFGLPAAVKRKEREGKLILKQLVSRRRLVPKSILQRPKRGFGPNLEAWMAGPLKEISEHLLDSKRVREMGLRVEEVRRLMKRREENTNKLYALMVLSLWHQEFVQGRRPRLDINTYL